MKKRTKQKIFRLTGLLISLVIVIFFFYSIINYTQLKEGYTQQSEPNYFILFLTTVFLEGFPQLISAALILASMILAGISVHKATFTVAIGSFIGSVAGFYVGYHYADKAIDLIMPKRAKESKRIKRYLHKYGKIFVAILAITPLPYFPVIFGGIKMRPKTFILYGALVRAFSYLLYGYFIYFVVFI